MLSVCGVNCATDCRAYKAECAGCKELSGKFSWAEFYDREDCPIYACVLSQGFSSCKDCGKQPCELWLQTRNPEATDAEFEADISSRLRNLVTYLSNPFRGVIT